MKVTFSQEVNGRWEVMYDGKVVGSIERSGAWYLCKRWAGLFAFETRLTKLINAFEIFGTT